MSNSIFKPLFIKGLFLLLSSCLLSSSFSQKGTPKWVDECVAQDKELYACVYYYKDDSETENSALSKAVEIAKSQLIEKIFVTVKSKLEYHETEENDETFDLFNFRSLSESNVEIPGLVQNQFYHKKKKMAYAQAYASKSKLIRLYKGKWIGINEQIDDTFSNARKLENQNLSLALKKYEACQLLITQRFDYGAILLGLGKLSPRNDVISLAQVTKKINDLERAEINDLQSLAFKITQKMERQMGNKVGRIAVAPLVIDDLGASSEFGKKIKDMIESELLSKGWEIISTRTALEAYNSKDIFDNEGRPVVEYTLRGVYKVMDSKIWLSIRTRNLYKNATIVSSFEESIPKKVIDDEEFSLYPKGYQNKKREIQYFQNVPKSKKKLKVKIYTNNTQDDPIFYEGENIHFSFEANMKSYVRLIYHLPDDTSILLIDNYFVDVSQVNKKIDSEVVLKSEKPFGLGILQANAQVVPFESLDTKQDGDLEIITENFNQTMSNSNSMRRYRNSVQSYQHVLYVQTVSK